MFLWLALAATTTTLVQKQSDLLPIVATLTSFITAVAVLLGVVVTLRGQNKIHDNVATVNKNVDKVNTKVEAVDAKVETTNGIAIGLLADRAEGRRIVADVPEDERTTSEQGYVDVLHETGRDLGHRGPEDKTVGPSGGTPQTDAERHTSAVAADFPPIDSKTEPQVTGKTVRAAKDAKDAKA